MKTIFASFFVVIMLVVPTAAFATGTTAAGTINSYGNGWTADTTSVTTTATAINPDGCASPVYMMAASDVYYRTFQATLLAAFLAQKTVYITVSGCISIYGTNYPHMVGLEVTP
jgi:hypothetical protein